MLGLAGVRDLLRGFQALGGRLWAAMKRGHHACPFGLHGGVKVAKRGFDVTATTRQVFIWSETQVLSTIELDGWVVSIGAFAQEGKVLWVNAHLQGGLSLQFPDGLTYDGSNTLCINGYVGHELLGQRAGHMGECFLHFTKSFWDGFFQVLNQAVDLVKKGPVFHLKGIFGFLTSFLSRIFDRLFANRAVMGFNAFQKGTSLRMDMSSGTGPAPKRMLCSVRLIIHLHP